MRPIARAAFAPIALLLVGGLIVQVFLAGLGVFDDARTFLTHRDVGYMLELLPFLLVVLGFVGRVERRLIGISALVLGLFFVQSILVGVRSDYPMVAALHPLNGFLILFLSIVNARAAWAQRGGGVAATA